MRNFLKVERNFERSNESSTKFRSGEVRNFGKCNEISPNLRSGGVRNFERRDENFVQNAYEICVSSSEISRHSADIIFSTRSSERFGNTHLASDLPTRSKQRIFP